MKLGMRAGLLAVCVAGAGCVATIEDGVEEVPALGTAVSIPEVAVAEGDEAPEEAASILEFGGLCDACTTNDDCGGPDDYCLRRSDGVRFCGQDCRSTGCPSGYGCRRLTTTIAQCVPVTSSCSPPPDVGTPDAGAPDAGASPDAGAPDASAQVPGTEACAAAADWAATSSAWEDEVLALTNQRRALGASCGGTAYPAVGPLVMDPALRCAARLHAKDMSDRGYFSHTTPDGVTFDQRITAAGYAWSTIGENIARGYRSPQAVVDGWMSSAGHCRNVMNGRYTQLGVGHHGTSNHWTQDFGRPR